MSYVEPAGVPGREGDSGAVVEQLRPFWAQFRRLRDPLGREELLIAYRFVCEDVLRELAPDDIGLNELAALDRRATRGLGEAIERFPDDADLAGFPEYATSRVRVAVTDGLERIDWLPRTLKRHSAAARSHHDGDLGGDGSPITPARGPLDLAASNWSARAHPAGHLAGSAEARLEEERAPFRALASTVGLSRLEATAEDPADQVRRAMRRMPEQQRTVLTLQFLAGLSLEQVGALLGTSLLGARRASEQALGTLRRAIEEDSGPLAAQAG